MNIADPWWYYEEYLRSPIPVSSWVVDKIAREVDLSKVCDQRLVCAIKAKQKVQKPLPLGPGMSLGKSDVAPGIKEGAGVVASVSGTVAGDVQKQGEDQESQHQQQAEEEDQSNANAKRSKGARRAERRRKLQEGVGAED